MLNLKTAAALVLALMLALTGCGSPKSGDDGGSFDKSAAAKAGEKVVKDYIDNTVNQKADNACALMTDAAQKRAIDQGVKQKLWDKDTTCVKAMEIGFEKRPVDDNTKKMVAEFKYTASKVTAKTMTVRIAVPGGAGGSIGYQLVKDGDKWKIDDLAEPEAPASPSAPGEPSSTDSPAPAPASPSAS